MDPVSILERARETFATRSPRTSTIHISESKEASPIERGQVLKLPAIETRTARF